MGLRSTITRFACATSFVLFLLFLAQTSARADDFTATIDTSSLIGTGTYQVAFVLDNPTGSANTGNTVTLTDLSFNGGSNIANTIAAFGGASVSGTGPGPTIIGTSTINLVDSSLDNAILTSFTPGSAITFSGTITSATSNIEFDVLIFDAAGDLISTTNSDGFVFVVTPTPPGATPGIVTTTYPITPTPEPSSLLMLSLGLAGVLGLGLTRKRARAAVAA